MTTDQYLVFGLLVVLVGFLIWGRIRYDMVAFGALVVAVLLNVVPAEKAFEGFGHPATIIIALVLVVSRGLANAGAVELVARFFIKAGRSVSAHIAIMAGVGAFLSAFMNNVGALALLMPVDMQAASKAKRSPAITLMPLSFATILGGLVTLIGTPPNIIVSAVREKELGAPFRMFDYAPAGIVAAVAGVLFVAFIGWRLLPKATRERQSVRELQELGTYLVELSVDEDAKAIGSTLKDLETLSDEHGVVIVALIRDGHRMPGYARWLELKENDILLIEAEAEELDAFVNALGVSYVDKQSEEEAEARRGRTIRPYGYSASGGDAEKDAETDRSQPGDPELMEVVVRPGAMIEGRTAAGAGLHANQGVWLIGISREGRKLTSRVRQMTIRAGDILLLLGSAGRLRSASDWMGTLPLAPRGLHVTDSTKAYLAGGLFALAVILASFGVLYLPIALAAVTVLYVLLNIVPIRQLYNAIEWPVVVLIGSLIPIGAALETSGGTQLIADSFVSIARGAEPWIVLTLLMVVTMTLSDVLNNTATAVIVAPVALGVANNLGVSPDPFLMAVAIAASCAFLSPIGHQNNTLIMGPGGYRFSDYWRMGLPLEIIVIAVSVPTILLVWPL
jgi:di/tricarboxylate transporter